MDMAHNSKGNPYRAQYRDSFPALYEKLHIEADKKRAEYFNDFEGNREKYLNDFKNMLGWPLNTDDKQVKLLEKTYVETKYGCDIYRMQFEILGCLKFYGMLFLQKDKTNLPLVICQHGGYGTPELCSTLLEGGSDNYNDMTVRVLSKGVNVFAPQLLLWNPQWFGNEFDRVNVDARLKQVGSSITAVEIHSIMRVIDVLSEFDEIDEQKIGMVGMSYGGFYTLFTTAIDERIKSAVACSHFNNRYKQAWTDWTWFESGEKFLDAEVLCLVAPRNIYIELGDNDELFDLESAKKEIERFKLICKNNSFAHFKAFEGKHEFYKGDEDIAAMINNLS